MEAQIALVISLVAIVRKYIPAIDGWKVLPVAALAAALVVLGGALPLPWGSPILKGLMLFVGAFGGTAFVQSLADRHAAKLGEQLGRNTLPPSEPSEPVVPASPPAPPAG